MAPKPINPCSPCAWFLEKGSHDWGIRIDACWCPERVIVTETEYRATNHKGPKCDHYAEGKQLRLGDK